MVEFFPPSLPESPTAALLSADTTRNRMYASRSEQVAVGYVRRRKNGKVEGWKPTETHKEMQFNGAIMRD